MEKMTEGQNEKSINKTVELAVAGKMMNKEMAKEIIVKAISSEEKAEQFGDLGQENVTAKIAELKQQINDIDQARTEGTLNAYFKWPNPREAEQLANSKVEKLENQIRELEKRSELGVVSEEKEKEKESKINISEEIVRRKKRIQQIEDAAKTGTLSLQYNFSPDHLNLANQEVHQLDEEIHALEKDIKVKDLEVSKIEESEFVSGQKTRNVVEVDSVKIDPSRENTQREPGVIKSGSRKSDSVSSLQKARRRIGIVETDLVEQQAHDRAEQNLNADKKELKGVNGFLKRIWKYNWANEYYRQKEIQKVKKEIETTGSIYGEKDLSGQKSAIAKEAILTRFLDKNPELIHDLAGEKFEANPKKKASAQIHLRGLMRDFALNLHTEESFTEERNRIIAQELGLNIKDPQSLAVSSELLDLAKNAKDALEHGESLNNLDLDFELVVGRAKSGTRTEAQMSTVDHLIEKIKGHSVGRFINETTIAAAYGLTVGVTQRAARSKAAAWLTFGGSALVGGVVMAATENVRLKRERAQMEREDASGQEISSAGMKRRQEMSQFILKKRNVGDLSSDLTASLYDFKFDGTRETKILSLEEYSRAVSALSDIESRVRISDSVKIDLLRYSDVENIEVERTGLDIERAKAKVELRKMFATHQALLGPNTFEEYLEKMTGAIEFSLINESSDTKTKQKLFQKFKRHKVGMEAIKGVAVGLTVGALAQEAGAVFNENQEGIIEHGVRKVFNGESTINNHSFTALEALRHYVSGGIDSSTEGLDHHLYTFGSGEHFRLPVGVEVQSSATGGFNLVDVHDPSNPHVLVNNISYDEQGNFSAESFKEIQDSGLVTTRQSYNIQLKEGRGVTTIALGQEVPVSTQDYVAGHGGTVSHIHRDWPIDSESPNHLGISDPVLNDEGNIVIKLNMTAQGSIMADGSHLDSLQAAAEGRFRIFFTDSAADQSYPAELIADPTGQVIIKPDNPIFKMFKLNQESHQIDVAPRFIEAGVLTDEAIKGGHNAIIIATQEGAGGGMSGLTETTGGGSMTKSVYELIDKKVHITNIDLTERGNFDLPPIIPILPRNPLEGLPENDKNRRGEGYYGKGGGFGLLGREQYESRMSPKFKENRNMDLSGNDADIIKEYLDRQESNYQSELENLVSGLPKMKNEIETVITVPAFLEGPNMEKTLRNYAKLKNRNKFELVILENHYRGTDRDNTKDVIDKIKTEFPDLNIVHLYKEFEEKQPIGALRKYLVDSVLVRKHLSKVGHSVTIVSNDADLEDISENYSDNIAQAFTNNPKLDIVSGKWDFPEKDYEKFPLLHAAQRLWQYYDIVFRHKHLKSPELIGRNSAFRSGIYAVVGGYNKNAKLAEDLEIGWLAKNARNYDKNRAAYLNKAWLISNSRRAVGTLLSGGSLVQQYGDFHENEEIRKKDLGELLAKDIDFDNAGLEKNIQALYEFYQGNKKSNGGWVEGNDETLVDEAFDRSLRFVGIKYHIEEREVEIGDVKEIKGFVVLDDISKLRKGLSL